MSTTGVADLVHRVEQDGFAVVPSCLNEEVIQNLAAHLSKGSYAKRNLLARFKIRTKFGQFVVSANKKGLVDLAKPF